MKSSALLTVLNHTKFGESSIVLHTLSREYGRRSFITSVSGSSKMSLFLPLNILEANVYESPKSTLWRASGFSAKYPLTDIRNNLYKNTMTLFMSEVLYRTIKDGANEDGLAEWCNRSILTLDAMPGDFSNFHLRFLLELAVVLGFGPSAEGLEPFAGKHLEVLRQLLAADFSSFMLYPLSGKDRTELAEILVKYLSHHTESSINIQSLKVLHEIFT